jgi:Calpain family cysteine protease
MRIRAVPLLVLAWVLGPGGCICFAAPKAKAPANKERTDAAFRQLFESFFARWDRNHDDLLDLKEINAVIRDPQVEGNESAAAAIVRGRLQKDEANESKTLTLPQMLALADDPQVQRAVKRQSQHIQGINHALFLSGDPNLATFHQGRMGDCYLLAPIGAMVYHRPQALRAMILPRNPDGFEVRFAAGRNVSVEPLTDAELIMGAVEGSNHGIWLAVLEKAYAQLARERKQAKTGQEIAADEAVTNDLIGHGGSSVPVIVLLTGHSTARASTGKWFHDDPAAAPDKVHALLVRLSTQHKVMTCAVKPDQASPKGIPHHHVFAVLDYNASTRVVRVFNPWGNHVKPNGPPGLANGYSIEHGIF